jgi:hypothetical protein
MLRPSGLNTGVPGEVKPAPDRPYHRAAADVHQVDSEVPRVQAMVALGCVGRLVAVRCEHDQVPIWRPLAVRVDPVPLIQRRAVPSLTSTGMMTGGYACPRTPRSHYSTRPRLRRSPLNSGKQGWPHLWLVLSNWGKQCKAIKDRLWFTAVSIS